MVPFSTSYIGDELEKSLTEDLWKIVEELLPDDEIPSKTLNHEQVLELCIMLKEAEEMFRMLEQIAILKKEIDKLKR